MKNYLFASLAFFFSVLLFSCTDKTTPNNSITSKSSSSVEDVIAFDSIADFIDYEKEVMEIRDYFTYSSKYYEHRCSSPTYKESPGVLDEAFPAAKYPFIRDRIDILVCLSWQDTIIDKEENDVDEIENEKYYFGLKKVGKKFICTESFSGETINKLMGVEEE